MGEQRTSYPRFRRLTDAPPIALTEDDISILRHVHRHRFVRTSDLYRLFADRSPDKISRRLARLYRAGFLDRPIAQIDRYRGGGSQPLVYGLDTAGARLLAESCGVAVKGDDWKGRNRSYTRENLDHTLAVTSFLVDAELACPAMPDFEFIRLEEILAGAPEGTRERAQPDRWPVILPWHGTEASVQIAPDGIFGLRRRTEGRQLKSYFFLEIDRGSMTIAPSDAVRRSVAFLYRSSVLRKLFAYAVSHRDGIHRRHFALPSARILMMTSGAARAEEMRRVAEELIVGPTQVPAGLFLFGWNCAGVNPLTMNWVDASGMATTLTAIR
jgi:hypothetical protein